MGEIDDFQSPVLTIEHDEAEAVATLWLDRPEARNAMGSDLWRDLPRAMDLLSADDGRARRRRGCQGSALLGRPRPQGDGQHAHRGGSGGGGGGGSSPSSVAARARDAHANVLRLQDSITSVARYPEPVVAAVHGYCIGGGVDLIAACDIRLASADAVLSVREAKMAIVADLGSLQRLPAIISAGHLAELAFTAKDISAQRAKEIGLVNDVAADAEGVHKAARSLAAEIAANSPNRGAGHQGHLGGQRGSDRRRGPGLRGHLERRHACLRRPDRGGDRLHGEAVAEIHRPLDVGTPGRRPRQAEFSACGAASGSPSGPGGRPRPVRSRARPRRRR